MRFYQVAAAALAASLLAPLSLSAQSTGLDGIARPSVSGLNTMKSYVLAARERATVIDGDTATRIYGGRAAKQGAWPAQVSLHSAQKLDGSQEAKFNSQFCGGSLIARQWVLSAAHCLVDDEGRPVSPDSVVVRSSSINLDEGDFRKVARVIVHPEYSGLNFENDIALLQLAQPITNAAGPVGAIPVLGQGQPVPQGPSVVIGWGMMEEGKFPANLMETDIDIVPNATCNKGMRELSKRELGGYLYGLGVSNRVPENILVDAYNTVVNNLGDPLSDNMICAGIASGARTSCSGDSGGPLMVRQQNGSWVQVGIVSWGRRSQETTDPCGIKDLYSVYTNVSKYYDWIAQNLRN